MGSSGTVTRRGFAAAIGGALIGSARRTSAQATAPQPRVIQTTLDLVPPDPRGFGAIPAHGFTFAAQNNAYGEDYVLPGSAATGSTRALHGDLVTADLVSATWRLAWNPLGDPVSGVQLSHGVQGYRDLTLIGEWTGQTGTTPIHLHQDVTDAVRGMLACKDVRFFVHKMRGTPIVFASTLELCWGLA